MSGADYIVIGIIAAAVIAVIVYIVRRKKSGKCIGCSGDCSACGKNTDKKGK